VAGRSATWGRPPRHTSRPSFDLLVHALHVDLAPFMHVEAVPFDAGAGVVYIACQRHLRGRDDVEDTYLILTTPRHGEFYKAITLPAQPGCLPPVESVADGQIGRACAAFGVELGGPLPPADTAATAR